MDGINGLNMSFKMNSINPNSSRNIGPASESKRETLLTKPESRDTW